MEWGIGKRTEADVDDGINNLCRLAIDQSSSAITALAQAFQPSRSEHGIRNDLERARQHLSSALEVVNAALGPAT